MPSFTYILKKIKMKNIFIVICCLLFISFSIFPQEVNVNGNFSSSVYSFQRFDTVNVSQNYLSSFQMLNLNINRGNFSLRSNMNLEADLASKLDGNPRLRFYNLYLEARNLFDIATIKLGRQPLFNSVAGGLFDGLTLGLKKGEYKFSAYYGGNVPAYQKLKLTSNWNDNFILGGKFTTDVIQNAQVSLSYIDKNFKPEPYWATRLDAALNPIQVLIENNSYQYQFASAEVYYDLENSFSVNTRYDYDLNFDKTSKFELDGSVPAIKDFNIDFYYNYRAPLISYNSIFSVFNYGNTQEMEIGGDYIINKDFTVSGRYGDVIYKDANSQRVSIGLITKYGSFNYRKTFGYAGELDALSLYTAHSFLKGLLTPSVGISYTKYKLSEASDANNLTTILAGVNVRPLGLLSFDIQGQYMNNSIYKNYYTLFLKLNYWFNSNF
jgi:hypothetical protein